MNLIKKYTTFLLLLACLTGLGSLNSCSDVSGENNPAPEATSEMPQLLPRTAGLGSPDERAQIAEQYDMQIAALRQNPGNPQARLALAELFINEARITGEHPYYYPLALAQLDAIPDDQLSNSELQFRAAYLRSSVLLSQHEFKAGLQAGEAAQRIYPRNAGIYGVLIDANVELGNYDKAVELSDKMVSLRPDLRSYSRISYLREIHGEWEGAIEAMKMAVSAGVIGTEQTSWCRLTLGQLYETYGDLENAAVQYQMLLAERSEYPFAYAGLASIEEKKGNLKASMEMLDKAISLIPEVGFYEQKAGLLEKMGRQAEADALVPEILAMMQEDSESGHIMDMEMAGVYLHLAGDPAKALQYASQAHVQRPGNVDVEAMMAEIYFQMGEYEKALQHADAAMKTNSKDPHKMLLTGMVREMAQEKGAGIDLIKVAFQQNPYLDGALALQAKDSFF